MIVPDVNLLVYAYLSAIREHAGAKAWWERILNSATPVGLAMPVLFGFVRLTTNRRVHEPPLAVEAALGHVESWLARPRVRLLLPGPRHLEIAFALLRRLGTAANLTTDVQLAALAVEHQAELHSNDADFARFSGLRWVNPLA
ncbi:MAG TPA: type II toxin-antitoxin system VapC family toxin [Polyangia bacterium]|nr:type II toxin-antitoxin system VapC family toxin [Polyangia bacterium]